MSDAVPRTDHVAPRIGAILFVAAAVLFIALVVRFWFVCDDAYISFRYAKHWADGMGLRFNPGSHRPVEGYSNFLWVALLAAIRLLGGNIVVAAPIISAASGLAVLTILHTILRRRFQLHPAATGMAVMCLAAFPPFAVWASSGLETMPFTLLMLLIWWALLLKPGSPAPVLAGVVALGVALIRTEGLAWALLAGGLAVWGRRLEGGRIAGAAARFLLPLLIGYMVYFAGRYAYFGELFANTAYAKVGLSLAGLTRGIDYAVGFFLAFLTPLCLFVALWPGATPPRRAIMWPLFGMSLANIAYAIAVTGDNMAMGRILMPGLILWMPVWIALLLDHLRRPGVAQTLARIWLASATILALHLLPAWNVHVIPRAIREVFSFRHHAATFKSEFEKWRAMKRNTLMRIPLSRHFATRSDKGDSLVTGAIGSVSYYNDLFIWDTNGLVCPEVARRKVAGPLVMPGHDKHVPYTYFLPQNPTFILSRVLPLTPKQVQPLVDHFRAQPEAASYAPDWFTPFDNAPPHRRRYFLYFIQITDTVEHTRQWSNFEKKLRTALEHRPPPA